jgi:hypothetical protein
MTEVWPPLRSSMASPYLYSTPIVEQTLRQGTPMASGDGASFARPLPAKRCWLRPCQGLYPVSCALQVGNSVRRRCSCRPVALRNALDQDGDRRIPYGGTCRSLGPLRSRAREQRSNERFLSPPLERSFGWFHEALVFETSLRSLSP